MPTITDPQDIRELWDTPITETVERLQDEGREIYIRGFSDTGLYALVVDVTGQQVCVANVATVNGIGRWECSLDFLRGDTELYAHRFPLY